MPGSWLVTTLPRHLPTSCQVQACLMGWDQPHLELLEGLLYLTLGATSSACCTSTLSPCRPAAMCLLADPASCCGASARSAAAWAKGLAHGWGPVSASAGWSCLSACFLGRIPPTELSMMASTSRAREAVTGCPWPSWLAELSWEASDCCTAVPGGRVWTGVPSCAVAAASAPPLPAAWLLTLPAG